MRTLFTIVALVLALAVVGLLARQQLSGASKSTLALPSAPGVAPHTAAIAPAVPPAQQVQQVQQAVEALVQQPRRLPDDSQ